MSARAGGRILGMGLALLGLLALFALLITRSESLPTGPREVIWDRTPCAECRMAVSERGYAAQLQTSDGRVLDFDDPGCLFAFLEENPTQAHALYFHHLREDRWLAAPEVAFLEAGPSPMAFDLGAVDPGTAGAITPAAARESALRRLGKERSDHE